MYLLPPGRGKGLPQTVGPYSVDDGNQGGGRRGGQAGAPVAGVDVYLSSSPHSINFLTHWWAKIIPPSLIFPLDQFAHCAANIYKLFGTWVPRSLDRFLLERDSPCIILQCKLNITLSIVAENFNCWVVAGLMWRTLNLVCAQPCQGFAACAWMPKLFVAQLRNNPRIWSPIYKNMDSSFSKICWAFI